MMLGTVQHIKYTNTKKDEVTQRTIIPVKLPSDNILSLDVTDLDDQQRSNLLALSVDYEKYRKAFIDLMFDFPTWIEHTTGEPCPIKWRSFVASQVEEIT